jgi:hypothetical protein
MKKYFLTVLLLSNVSFGFDDQAYQEALSKTQN